MEERDDYPIIPQTEGSESKMEQVAYEIAMKIVNVPDNKPEHAADHKLHSIHSIVMNTMRMVEREKGKELASLKEENALLKECFELSEQAKNHLRTKGYGWTGLDILKTCELVPFSDNK